MKKHEKNEKLEQKQEEMEQGRDSEDQQADGDTGIVGISGVLKILDSKKTLDDQKAQIIILLKRSDIFNSADRYLKQLLGIVQSKIKRPILPALLRSERFDLYQLVVARVVYSKEVYSDDTHKYLFGRIDTAMSKCKDEAARTYYQEQRENWNIDSQAFKEALRLLDIDEEAEAEKEREKERAKEEKAKVRKNEEKPREYTKLPHVHDILNKEEGENQKKEIIKLLKRPDIFAGGKANRRSYLGIIKASHGSEETVVLPKLLQMKRFDLYQLFVAKIVYSDLYECSHEGIFSIVHKAMLICDNKEARQFYEAQCGNWNLKSPEFKEALKALDIPEDNSKSSEKNNKSKKGKQKEMSDESENENESKGKSKSKSESESESSESNEDGESSSSSEESEYEAETKKETKKAPPSKKVKAEKEKEPRALRLSKRSSLPPKIPLANSQALKPKTEPEMKQQAPYNPTNLTDLKPVSRAAIILRDQYVQTRSSSSSSSSSNIIDEKMISECFIKIKAHYSRKIRQDRNNRFEKDAKEFLDKLQESAASEAIINRVKQEVEKGRKVFTTVNNQDVYKAWELAGKEQDSKFIQNAMKDDFAFHVLRGIYILETSQYTDNESKITLRQAVVFVWNALTQGEFLIKPADQTIEEVIDTLMNVDFCQMLYGMSDLRTDIPKPDFAGAFSRIIEILSKVHAKISVCNLSKENIPGLIIKFYEEKFKTSPPNIQQAIVKEIFYAKFHPSFANMPLKKFFEQLDWYIEFMKSVDPSIRMGLFTQAEVAQAFIDLSSLASMNKFPGLDSVYKRDSSIFQQRFLGSRSSSSSTASLFSPPKPTIEQKSSKEEKAPVVETEESEEPQPRNNGKKEADDAVLVQKLQDELDQETKEKAKGSKAETSEEPQGDAALAKKIQDELYQEMMDEDSQSETEDNPEIEKEKEREPGKKAKRRETPGADSSLFGSGKKAKSVIGEVTAHANQLIQHITSQVDEAKQNSKGLKLAFHPFFERIRKAPTIDKINEVMDQVRQGLMDSTDHLYKEADRAGILSSLLQDPNLFPQSASSMVL